MPNTGRVDSTVVLNGFPHVNLMPREIAEAAKFRRFQFAMGATLVGAVVVVAGLTYQAHHGVAAAKQQLATSTTQHAQLQQQLASLQSVQDVYDQYVAKQAILQQAMGDEIRWSYYLEDLSLKIPSNVWLTSVSATESSAGVPGATATTVPGSTSGIGSINFAGVAFSHDDVATWLDVLAKEKGYASPYFSNSTEGLLGTRKVVNFSSSVVLTPAAESGRYTASGS
jgi:Tfp pilus assembly protein PilN